MSPARPGTQPVIADSWTNARPWSLLTTLADMADRPGELSGLGPVDPSLARDLATAAARNPKSTWCVTVTDEKGHTVAHGCARPEPKSHRKRAGPGPPGETGFSFIPDSRDGPPNGYGTWRLRTPGPGPDLIITVNPLTTDPCDHRSESRGHDPGVKLRHLSQVRHATCTSPIRRRPAAQADFEHNTPYEAGGRRCLCNGGPVVQTITTQVVHPAFHPWGGWLWLRTQQTPYAGLQCRAGAARSRILGYDVTIIGGSAMEMRAFESVDQAADSAIAMLQDGERLSRLWRYVFVQMLDDYTSVLHHAGVSAAAEMWASAPRSTGDVRVDAAFAAMAEYLARRDGWTVPSWARLPEREAWPWWFVTDLRGLHPRSLVESPSSFRRRGVFITSGALDRA